MAGNHPAVCEQTGGKMRLICPNCGAQYEVDEAVIPEQGRDVQCSNCGHTWFQHRSQDLPEEQVETVEIAEDPAPAPRERKRIDPDVANVLREEAAREAAARAAEAEAIETQPDLGLEEQAQVAADRSAAARARMARLRGLDDSNSDAEAAVAGVIAAAGSRKELLPDVDEINSSLRSDKDPERVVAETGPEIVEPERQGGGGGFKWAFRFVVLVVALGVILYIMAPTVVAQMPQAEPFLVPYVDWVNGLRAQVNPLVENAVTQVRELVGI